MIDSWTRRPLKKFCDHFVLRSLGSCFTTLLCFSTIVHKQSVGEKGEGPKEAPPKEDLKRNNKKKRTEKEHQIISRRIFVALAANPPFLKGKRG